MENIEVSAAWLSDIGKRPANEDSCAVIESDELGGKCDGVYIVADGMGGRASGAEASVIAVSMVKESLLDDMARATDIPGMLTRALKAANSAVYAASQSDTALQGMGTTCVAAIICGGRLHYAHLGDSRAYLLRDARLIRLTEDHSFVAEKVRSGELTEEQARKSRFRNIITKSVGIEPDVEPESGSMDLEQGDILLLCTDGLTGPVGDDDIVDILLSTKASDIKQACNKLVDAAISKGGSDNITVILVTYGTPTQPRQASRNADTPSPAVRKAPWLMQVFGGLLLGLALATFPGHDLIGKFWASPPSQVTDISSGTEPAAAPVEYDEPVSLLYTQVQGGALALDNGGYIHLVDQLGQMIRLDKSGGIVYTTPGRIELKPHLGYNTAYMGASDQKGNVYVSDLTGKRILKYDNQGMQQEIIAAGKLTKPQAIAVDAEGAIYVVDAGRLKVIRPRVHAK